MFFSRSGERGIAKEICGKWNNDLHYCIFTNSWSLWQWVLHGNRNLTDMIKVTDFECKGHPTLFKWTQSNLVNFWKQRIFLSCNQREMIWWRQVRKVTSEEGFYALLMTLICTEYEKRLREDTRRCGLPPVGNTTETSVLELRGTKCCQCLNEQGSRFLLRVSDRKVACWNLNFSQMKSKGFLTYSNFKVINMHCFKPLLSNLLPAIGK